MSTSTFEMVLDTLLPFGNETIGKPTTVIAILKKLKAMQAASDALYLPVIEDDSHSSEEARRILSLLGGIEIEMVEDKDENGHIITRFLKIMCLPPMFDPVNERALKFMSDAHEDDDSVLEQRMEESSMLEHIANTFMESCISNPCDTELKSALKKSGDTRKMPRSVIFDKIDIHEFNMTLGDHPSAVSGPPLAINWETEPRVSRVSLDEYERSRQPRRHKGELRIPLKTRCGILQSEGKYSPSEIIKAWEEAIQVRKQRAETLKGGMSKMYYDDFWESANRKFKRVTDSITGMIL